MCEERERSGKRSGACRISCGAGVAKNDKAERGVGGRGAGTERGASCIGRSQPAPTEHFTHLVDST